MENNEFPFGTQFTPNQVDLDKILLYISENESETSDGLIDYLFQHTKNKTMANNCKNSLVAYGILKVGGGCFFSDFGKNLFEIKDSRERLNYLVKNILKNLNGLLLIDALRDLKRSGIKITNESLIDHLNSRGFNLSKTSNHTQSMKLWLEKAGILNGWDVNEENLEKLIIVNYTDVDELKTLSKEQYLFFRTLCSNYNGNYQKAAEIRDLSADIYKVKYIEKSFKSQIINPLREKGFIKENTKNETHGGTSPDIKPSEKSILLYNSSIIKQLENFFDNQFIKFISKSISELYSEINSKDTYIKGLALEALAIKIMQMIGLSFVQTRLRGNQTGGAEVDIIFESTELLYSRWQVQCKNTERVELDQIAKEVGLSHMLKSNAIVILTTGKISAEAKRYSDTIMKNMNLCIIHVDGDDLRKIIEKPIEIRTIFNRESLKAKQIKILDLKS